MRLSDINVSASWLAAGDRLSAAQEPSALVVGAVDSGKSVLCRYLLGRLIRERGACALLDGDVGMATVGPPGLVGLTLVLDVDALDTRSATDRAWFVGSTTPQSCLLPVLVGHVKLAAVARSERMPLVVNTSGFVSGGAAKELQLAIVDAVNPGLIFGLQHEDEIEHLLRPLERRGATVVRLAPSARARTKPRAERMSLRAERFGRYFAEAPVLELSLEDFALEGALLGSGVSLPDDARAEVERGLDTHVVEAEQAGDGIAVVLASAPNDEGAPLVHRALGGRSIHVLEAPDTTGVLVGLLAADGECLGLGILEAWRGEGVVELRTPLGEGLVKQAKRLRIGTLRLSRNGDELGFSTRERVLEASET